MTITLTDAAPTVPTFPACPDWCDQNNAHDPHGEIGHQHGVGTLAPRLHEVETGRIRTDALHYGHHVDVAVSVFREDHGSYTPGEAEAGAPTAEIGVFEHHGHSVVYRPTAAQLRAMAAAYDRAADLLDGTSR